MTRPIFIALALGLALASSSPAAAAEQFHSTFKGDGFDASLSSYDGCRDISIYFSGTDYATKAGAGAPTSTNYLYGYAWIFDCETQAWGNAFIDVSNATMAANGAHATASFRGAVEVALGRWEQTGELVCYTWGDFCWIDWDGNEICEAGGEYCFDEWRWVTLPSQTLAFDLAIDPSGDAYHGMNMTTQKAPYGMYRSRYSGTQRYGTLTGALTLDGEDLMAGAYSYASLWTASSGSLSLYRN